MPPYNTINLHPPTHPLSALRSTTFDVICIGSGWPASITSARVSKAGLTSLIIESELFGGDCPFWACVPSKALLRPSDALDEAKRVGGSKETIQPDGVDANAVFQRRDEWTSNWDDTKVVAPLYESLGAHLVRGRGTLVGAKKVKVEDLNGDSVILEARHAVVLATGSEPAIPDIPGLAEAKPWTPREATSSSKVPEHLVVLGAGAVGCEMACAYAGFGSKVSLVCSTAELLPRMDAEAGAMVRQSLEKQGVDVYVSATITGVRRDANGSLLVDRAGKEVIRATDILVAAGRKPKVQGIGLEELGIEVDGSPIAVDESLCVKTVPGGWLYAGGDVNGRAQMTHMAKYHARVMANSILARKDGSSHQSRAWSKTSATADHVAVPQVVFTRPAVASVGLTRRTAQAAGKKVKEITAPAKTEGAELRIDGYEDGLAQWIVDEDTGKLLGATYVGDDVAELLHASTVAIVGGLTLDQLWHAVPSFPTMSEVYLNLLEAAGL